MSAVSILRHSPYFNPRTREGCDRPGSDGNTTPRHFNPRTREGCDSSHSKNSDALSHFNPRTREGCDDALVSCADKVLDISIHAPARGATK